MGHLLHFLVRLRFLTPLRKLALLTTYTGLSPRECFEWCDRIIHPDNSNTVEFLKKRRRDIDRWSSLIAKAGLVHSVYCSKHVWRIWTWMRNTIKFTYDHTWSHEDVTMVMRTTFPSKLRTSFCRFRKTLYRIKKLAGLISQKVCGAIEPHIVRRAFAVVVLLGVPFREAWLLQGGRRFTNNRSRNTLETGKDRDITCAYRSERRWFQPVPFSLVRPDAQVLLENRFCGKVESLTLIPSDLSIGCVVSC